jgi:hypothetical protein
MAGSGLEIRLILYFASNKGLFPVAIFGLEKIIINRDIQQTDFTISNRYYLKLERLVDWDPCLNPLLGRAEGDWYYLIKGIY